jgi:hypothetical protein
MTDLEKRAIAKCEEVKQHSIVTIQDREVAESQMAALKELEDEIFAYLDPPRDKAYKDYQYHKDRLDVAINPVKATRKTLKNDCGTFDREQERLRKAEEARLNAIAQKQAEDDALAAAQAAAEAGDHEVAEEILKAPIVAPTVRVPTIAPTPSRLTAGRSHWTAKGIDLMATCQAVVDGKAPLAVLEWNMPVLNKMATALHSELNIPGVKSEETFV